MRIGILAFLHESNTFVQPRTTIERFHEDLFLQGDAIRKQLYGSHHEVGGFLAGLDEFDDAVRCEPLVALRATPWGMLTSGAFEAVSDRILMSLQSAGSLDGLLIAAHGAAVSENFPDADGEWLSRIRNAVGSGIPIVATLDLHGNLSPRMVDACDAMVAYRTNPHLDQRARGQEAARLLVAMLRNEIRPTMAAAFPPMLISIQRQCTEDPHLRAIYQVADQQREQPHVLSNSILLGFPYADVPEMGAATVVITDDDASLARRLADDLAGVLWQTREAMHGDLIDVAAAMDAIRIDTGQRICLLDMGDNVGGGSAADGTFLLHALWNDRIGPSLACIYDPEAVQICQHSGVGVEVGLRVGGKTDDLHGATWEQGVVVDSLHDGRFREDQPRHGGIVDFDQGPTAIVRTIDGTITLVLTSRRMAPFSLGQLTSCKLDPRAYRILVAKGVNAPIAAYRDVCDEFLRVNTDGSTCADVTRLRFQHRRRPLFPFEIDTTFERLAAGR